MIAPPFRHGTASAREGAARLGLIPEERDFRAAFLAITDAVLGHPAAARYVGPTRDAEGWTVCLCGQEVDVIYVPARASVTAPHGRGGGVSEQLYRWFWRARLPERRGQLFRVLCRGKLNSCLIEFCDDGRKVVTSRNALRKVRA